MLEQNRDARPARDAAPRGWSRPLCLVAVTSVSVLATAFAEVRGTQDPKPAAAPGGTGPDVQRPVVVKRGGPRPVAKRADVDRPGGFFTGSASVERMFPATEPSHLAIANVTFEPGARTVWHSHPLGQTLVVTDGTGWVQGWGGKVQEIRAGDVVQTPPNQKHWHGATATTGMTHISIVEHLNGKNVEAMERVSDEQYRP